MLSADDLRIFLEVARRGRLTEAARHLKLNHTTVGRHISQLERSVGQRLFVRSSGGWVVTESGARLLAHAETIEAALISANEDCLLTGSYLTGSVRCVTPDGFGSYLLLPGLGRFEKQIGGLTVEVVIANRHASLTSREFDLAVTIERAETRAVTVRKLADYTLRFYGSPSYLASRPPIAGPEQIPEHHELIWYVDEALGAATFQTIYQLVPTAVPRVTSNSIAGQIQAAQQGLGLAFLPSYLGDALPGLERLPGIEAGVPHSYWLLTPKNLDRVAKVTIMTRVLDQLVYETEGLEAT